MLLNFIKKAISCLCSKKVYPVSAIDTCVDVVVRTISSKFFTVRRAKRQTSFYLVNSYEAKIFTGVIFVVFAGCVSALAQTSWGTSVVSVKKNGEMIIAADSKSVNAKGENAGNNCKIRVVKGIVIATAGLREYVRNGKTASIADDVERACSTTAIFSQKAADLEKAIVPILLDILPGINQDSPQKIGVKGKPKPVLSVILATVESGEILFVRKQFNAFLEGESIGLEVKGKVQLDPLIFDAVGEVDAIGRYYRANPKMLDSVAPLELATMLVRLEIADKPNNVGYPISVLKISSLGITWIEKGECQDSTSDKPKKSSKKKSRHK